MSAPQQFSLRWNNYSQHIVTALEDLRADDELTDVTLSCEGQRIKGHKILLSACSSYFRDTFKENPCKHPIIILKGVSFVDLEAVVTFMYNGQVNVSQERLPTFLQTAELLQIKGLTDMNEKEDVPKKRVGGNLPINQNSNSSLSHSASRSGTPDIVQQRPPSPKRKRVALDNFTNDGASTSSGVFPSSSSNTPTQPVMGGTGSNGPTAGSSTGGGSSGLTSQSSSMVMPTVSGVTSLASTNQTDSDDPFNPNVSIKYEDDGLQDDDDYDEKHNMSSEDNDNSIQDMMCNVEPGSIGSFMGGSGQAGLGTSGTDSSHAVRDGGEAEVTGVLRNEDQDWDFEDVRLQVEEQQRERDGGNGTSIEAGSGTIIKDGKRYWRWTQTRSFPNISEAVETLRLEGVWSTAYKYDTTTGHKQYYRCKSTRKCPVLMYLMCHNNSERVTQFGNNESHVHVAVRGMSDELKGTIVQFMSDGYTKPNQILAKLAEIGIEIQKDRVKTFLRTLRKAE